MVADPDAEQNGRPAASMAGTTCGASSRSIKAAVKAVTDERDALEARIRAQLAQPPLAPPRVYGCRSQLAVHGPHEGGRRERFSATSPPSGRSSSIVSDSRPKPPDPYDLARQPIGARRLTTKETS